MSTAKNDINSFLEKTFSNLELNLADELESKLSEYGLSRAKATSLLGIDRATFDEIIDGTAKHPSLINVIKIANFLELNIEEIIPSVLKHQTEAGIKSIHSAEKATFIAKNFDLKALGKAGFFKNSSTLDDVDYIENRILTFFGFSSLKEYQKETAPLFSKTKRAFSDRMKTFWVNSAYQCFKKINNPNPYDREALKELLPKIKPYCQDVENGLLIVCRALYSVGVTVIAQNQLTLTGIRGGTFIVNDKPCIVLTDLNKRYTTVWEILIHELSHALFDFSIIKANVFHLSGDPDLFLIEEKAEKFAQEFFCGYEDYKYIKPHIGNAFMVIRLARDLEIHPAFVYSSFRLFEFKLNGKNYYKAFNEHFPPATDIFKNISPVSWFEESLIRFAEKTQFDLETKTQSNHEEGQN